MSPELHNESSNESRATYMIHSYSYMSIYTYCSVDYLFSCSSIADGMQLPQWRIYIIPFPTSGRWRRCMSQPTYFTDIPLQLMLQSSCYIIDDFVSAMKLFVKSTTAWISTVKQTEITACACMHACTCVIWPFLSCYGHLTTYSKQNSYITWSSQNWAWWL